MPSSNRPCAGRRGILGGYWTLRAVVALDAPLDRSGKESCTIPDPWLASLLQDPGSSGWRASGRDGHEPDVESRSGL